MWAGVTVDLVTWTDGRFGLDVTGQYRYRGVADYLVGGEKGFAPGVSAVDVTRSRTDLFILSIGGALSF